MDNFAITTAAARLGAARTAACSPWTAVVAAGANYAPGWNLALAVGVSSGVRGEAMSHRAVLSALARPLSGEQQFAVKRGAELLPTTVTVNRKPMNAHKTRINAGGYGAMGPHPERERLA